MCCMPHAARSRRLNMANRAIQPGEQFLGLHDGAIIHRQAQETDYPLKTQPARLLSLLATFEP